MPRNLFEKPLNNCNTAMTRRIYMLTVIEELKTVLRDSHVFVLWRSGTTTREDAAVARKDTLLRVSGWAKVSRPK